MIYTSEHNKSALDKYANDISFYLKCLMENPCVQNNPSDSQFSNILGDISYLISNIFVLTAGELDCAKITMITGVLESIKEDLYKNASS